MAKGYTSLSEKMRNVQFRGKTFVIIASIVTVAFLAFNFWTLSAQNNDMQGHVEKLRNKIEISSQRQRELEEEVQTWKGRFEESQQETRKLESDLRKKEEVVNMQAEESAMFRDKVRLAEAEVEKLKNQLGQKETEFQSQSKKIESLEKQLEEKSDLISEGNSKLKEAQDLIAQLQEQAGSVVTSEPGQIQSSSPRTTVAVQLQTSSTSKPAEANQVLAKPEEENETEDLAEKPGSLLENENPADDNQELEFKDVDKDINVLDNNVAEKNGAEDQEVAVLAAPGQDNHNLGQAVEAEVAEEQEEEKKNDDLPVLENKNADNLDRLEDDETNRDFDADQGDNENE